MLDLPDLSALVPGYDGRRRRRPEGRGPAIAPCGLARRRCGLAVAVLQVSDGRHGLRRFGLLRRRSAVRHACRLRRGGRGSAPAGAEGHHRPGAVAFIGSASVVRREPVEPHEPEIRLVCLGGCQAGRHSAQQLAFGVRRAGLGMGRGSAAVLHAQLPGLAAGPQLPQSGCSGCAAGCGALLAGTRGRRVPAGHRQSLCPRRAAAR